jgi:hypothetical protein
MMSVQSITLYLHTPEHFSCSIIMRSPHASHICRVTLLLCLYDCVFISAGLIGVLMLYFNNFFYLLLPIWALEVPRIVTTYIYINITDEERSNSYNHSVNCQDCVASAADE